MFWEIHFLTLLLRVDENKHICAVNNTNTISLEQLAVPRGTAGLVLFKMAKIPCQHT